MSRSVAAHESVPGGWSTLYKVYRELEEQGQVRRGHFVDGLEGAQFAYAGAVDRLRGVRDEAEDRDTPAGSGDVVSLAVADPANPWGSQLAWPMPAFQKIDGALETAIEALRELPKGNRKGLLVIEKIDGVNVLESPLLESFREADFGSDYRGLVDVRAPGATPSRERERRA